MGNRSSVTDRGSDFGARPGCCRCLPRQTAGGGETGLRGDKSHATIMSPTSAEPWQALRRGARRKAGKPFSAGRRSGRRPPYRDIPTRPGSCSSRPKVPAARNIRLRSVLTLIKVRSFPPRDGGPVDRRRWDEAASVSPSRSRPGSRGSARMCPDLRPSERSRLGGSARRRERDMHGGSWGSRQRRLAQPGHHHRILSLCSEARSATGTSTMFDLNLLGTPAFLIDVGQGAYRFAAWNQAKVDLNGWKTSEVPGCTAGRAPERRLSRRPDPMPGKVRSP